jgi:hypothetical protein
MSHINNLILEEQEFSRKEIEAMPEPESPDVCEFCNGTGEVSVDESDGEGHIMNGVGTQKCICRLQD